MDLQEYYNFHYICLSYLYKDHGGFKSVRLGLTEHGHHLEIYNLYYDQLGNHKRYHLMRFQPFHLLQNLDIIPRQNSYVCYHAP